MERNERKRENNEWKNIEEWIVYEKFKKNESKERKIRRMRKWKKKIKNNMYVWKNGRK